MEPAQGISVLPLAVCAVDIATVSVKDRWQDNHHHHRHHIPCAVCAVVIANMCVRERFMTIVISTFYIKYIMVVLPIDN